MLKLQNDKYGLGFSIQAARAAAVVQPRRPNEGFRCLLVGMPATGQGVVIMTNSDTGSGLLPEVLAVVSRVYNWPVQ